jgi:HSP20 family protein
LNPQSAGPTQGAIGDSAVFEEANMVIRVRDPFATLLGLQRAMENVMGNDWFGSRTSGSGAFPLINVFNDGDDFVVVAELPGVKKEDLDIQVRGETVRIQGKKTIAYDENASVHRRERAAGQFDRTLTLPDDVDAQKVSAEYRDGVLTLRLPRAESAKPRTVTIN